MMMELPIWACALIVAAAYLTGSLSPAVWIARAWGGFDLRGVGSGNPGTTNVLRSMGWLPAVLTFVGDFCKGFLIPFLASVLISREMGYWCAAAALIGHAFPVFLHFRGGKCVATGLGAMVALFPLGGACLAAYLLIVALSTRIVSLAAVTGFPLYALALVLIPSLPPDGILPPFAVITAIFVLWRHRSNILRLVTGQEKPMHVPKDKKKK